MRTSNWQQCMSLDRLLVLCEDHRDRLEAMASGKALLDRLRESVRAARDHFMTSRAAKTSGARSGGPKGARRLVRNIRASLIRLQVHGLLWEARRIAAATGADVELPKLRWGSHRRLIEETELALTAIAPLAGALGPYRTACYESLPRQIEALCAVIQEQDAQRGRGKAMSAALKKGWEAVAGLDPLFFAVEENSEKTAEWKKLFGPDRRARLRLQPSAISYQLSASS